MSDPRPLDARVLLAALAPIEPPEGGVRRPSVALSDQIRSIDRSRLLEAWGSVEPGTHRRIVALVLRILAPRE